MDRRGEAGGVDGGSDDGTEKKPALAIGWVEAKVGLAVGSGGMGDIKFWLNLISIDCTLSQYMNFRI